MHLTAPFCPDTTGPSEQLLQIRIHLRSEGEGEGEAYHERLHKQFYANQGLGITQTLDGSGSRHKLTPRDEWSLARKVRLSIKTTTKGIRYVQQPFKARQSDSTTL